MTTHGDEHLLPDGGVNSVGEKLERNGDNLGFDNSSSTRILVGGEMILIHHVRFVGVQV